MGETHTRTGRGPRTIGCLLYVVSGPFVLFLYTFAATLFKATRGEGPDIGIQEWVNFMQVFCWRAFGGKLTWTLLVAFVAGVFFSILGLWREFAGFRVRIQHLMVFVAIAAIVLASVPSGASLVLLVLFAPALLTYFAMLRRLVLAVALWRRTGTLTDRRRSKG
jgi:hypothetical protein